MAVFAVQKITARTAMELIIPGATENPVMTVQALKHIVAFKPQDHIVAVSTLNMFGAGAAYDHISTEQSLGLQIAELGVFDRCIKAFRARQIRYGMLAPFDIPGVVGWKTGRQRARITYRISVLGSA